MSTFCLDFTSSPTATSAPSELDSDCMEHKSAHNMKPPPGTGGFLQDLTGRSLLYPGPGGLGLALEEELAMLAGEQEDCGDMAGLEAPINGQDPDLLSLIRHKEKDLVLAARLGKALLERNQDLTRQYENMHKDLTEQLEVRLNHGFIFYMHDCVDCSQSFQAGLCRAHEATSNVLC